MSDSSGPLKYCAVINCFSSIHHRGYLFCVRHASLPFGHASHPQKRSLGIICASAQINANIFIYLNEA